MKFLPYFLIFLIISLSAGCSLTNPIKKEHAISYLHLMDNETENAREHLDKARNNYIKNFLLSCLELSEGNLDMAKQYAEQVVHSCDDLPEGKVLVNLINRRETHPEENWVNSYVLAWKQAGEPELLLPLEIGLNAEFDVRRIQKHCAITIPDEYRGKAEGLLLSYNQHIFDCNTQEYLELLLTVTPEMPFEIKLLVFTEIELWSDDENIQEELRERLIKKRNELINQLSEEQASYMYFAIVKIMEHIPENSPLTDNDILKLEKAVSREKMGPSRYDLFNYYLTFFKEMNINIPLLHASDIANSVYTVYPLGFSFKIKESTKEASGQRKEKLAKILEKAAKVTLKRRTLIDYVFGGSLLMHISNIRGDKELEEEAKELKRYTAKLTYQTMSSPAFWPIHPLLDDSVLLSMEDEVNFFQLFSDEKTPEVISEIIQEPL